MYRRYLKPRQGLFSQQYMSMAKSGVINIKAKKGPVGGTGIDSDPALSFLKSCSESLDRRSSMIWYKQDKLIDCFDLVTCKTSRLKKSYFALKTNERDTTGTAAHPNGEEAVLNALLESFQKTSLAFIWYNNCCSSFVFKGHKSLINLDFFPIITTLVMIQDNDTYFFGMGTSTSPIKAFYEGYNEAILLQNQNSNYFSQINHVSRFKYTMSPSNQSDHFKRIFEKSPRYKIDNMAYKEEFSIRDIKKYIPKNINHIYISKLPNYIYPKEKVVRVYSKELFNQLPQKKNVLVNNTYLKNYQISREEIENIPEIPLL